MGLAGLAKGHDDAGEAGLDGRQGGRQDAAHRPDPAVQPELAQQRRVPQLLPAKHVLRGQHRGHDAQVVVAAGLGQRRRAEVDGQQRDGPLLARVADRRLASVTGLVERAVGQARPAPSAADRHRCRPRPRPSGPPGRPGPPTRRRPTPSQPTALTWVSDGSCPGTMSTPMASSRMPVRRDPVLPQPVRGQLPERLHLGEGDGLQRMPEAQPGAALDLAEDQRDPAVAHLDGDDVDLPQRAPPVAVNHLQALAHQLRARQVLAPSADLLLGLRSRHTPPPTGSMRTPTPDRPGSAESVETGQSGLWTAD